MCLHTLTTFHQPCLHLVETPRCGLGYVPPRYCDEVKFLLDLYHTQPLRLPQPEPLKIPSPCKIDYGNGPPDYGNIVSRVSTAPCQYCYKANRWVELGNMRQAMTSGKMASQYGEYGGFDVEVGAQQHTTATAATAVGLSLMEYFGYAAPSQEVEQGTLVIDLGMFYRQRNEELLKPEVQAKLAGDEKVLRKKHGQPEVPRRCRGGGAVIVEDCAVPDYRQEEEDVPPTPPLTPDMSIATFASPERDAAPTLQRPSERMVDQSGSPLLHILGVGIGKS